MRLVLASVCALSLCAPGPTFPSPHPVGLASRAAPASRPVASAAPVAGAVALDVGDIIVPIAIDLSVWIGTRIMAIIDELVAHIDEDYRRARGHGDSAQPLIAPDPTLVDPATAAAPVPVSPSTEYTP